MQTQDFKLTQTSFSYIPGNPPGKRIGMIVFRESGYWETTYDTGQTEPDCRAVVSSLNARYNVPEDVAQSSFMGSMFGWSCPGAARAAAFFSNRTEL